MKELVSIVICFMFFALGAYFGFQYGSLQPKVVEMPQKSLESQIKVQSVGFSVPGNLQGTYNPQQTQDGKQLQGSL